MSDSMALDSGNKTDWLIELNEFVAQLVATNDHRIRKNEHKLRFKNLLETLLEKNIIQTHAFIVNWLGELLTNGEMKPKTVQDVIRQMPWAWDKSRALLDTKKKEGLLEFTRDSKGRKICIIKIKDGLQKIKQITNLFNFLKGYPEQSGRIVVDFYKEYKAYNTSLYKWMQNEKALAGKIGRYESASEEELDELIENIGSLAILDTGREFQKRLLDLIKKEPLLLYSLRKR